MATVPALPHQLQQGYGQGLEKDAPFSPISSGSQWAALHPWERHSGVYEPQWLSYPKDKVIIVAFSQCVELAPV